MGAPPDLSGLERGGNAVLILNAKKCLNALNQHLCDPECARDPEREAASPDGIIRSEKGWECSLWEGVGNTEGVNARRA